MGGDSSNQEIELKIRVDDAAALDTIVAALPGRGPDTVVEQTNHFFETPRRQLRGLAAAVRLREEDGRFILTAKGGAKGRSESGVLSVRREEEREIPADQARALLAGELDPLALLAQGAPSAEAFAREIQAGLGRPEGAGSGLGHVGSFTNTRRKVPFSLGINGRTHALELEVDTTVFPGDIVQHEVELEISADLPAADIEKWLSDLLESVGVKGRSAPGKATRFFQALAGLPIG